MKTPNRFRIWIKEDIESMFMCEPYIKANQMVYPETAIAYELALAFNGMVFFVDWNYSDTYTKFLEPHQYILMHATGVKDTNRIEIYEKDIVEFNLLNGKRDRMIACYQFTGGYNGWNITELNMVDAGYLVIGNVLQNPDIYKEILYGKDRGDE